MHVNRPGLALVLALSGCGAPAIQTCGGQSDPLAGPRVPWLTDVTAFSTVGSTDVDNPTNPLAGGGAAVGDLDGDGLVDLVLTAGTRGDTRVYLNVGGLHFTDAGAALPGANGAALADLDGDGDADLILADESGNAVFENDGAGHFVARAQPVGDATSCLGVLPADFDGDGRVDLYFYSYAQGSTARTRNHLLRNLGNFGFADVTDAYGLTEQGNTWTASWFDFDGDGNNDLYVANDSFVDDAGAQGLVNPPRGPDDELWANRGNGRFEDVTAAAGLGTHRSSMGGLVGDFDGDGRLDLYVSNAGKNHLFLNGGDGTFTDGTDRFGIGVERRSNEICPPTATNENCLLISWGATLFDVDHDGADDLLVMNGSIDMPEDQPERGFRGVPGAAFQPVTPGFGCQAGRALVPADLDGDGDLDLVMTAHDQPARIFRNDAPSGRGWLRVRLVGTRSNRDGIGARVTFIRASGRRVVRPIGAGGIVHSSAPFEAHFVAGNDPAVSVEVRWPSGAVQTIDAPALDQVLTVTEPAP